MRIFQLIFSDKLNDDLQYANELYDALNIYYSDTIEVNRLVLNNPSEFSNELINIINLYDYLFIHCINNLDRESYMKICRNIHIKKILFIVDSNIKEFNLKYDLTMMRSLLLCCNRVVVNKYGVEIKNNLIKLLNNFDQTIIDLDYICNFDKVMVEDIVKNKEISLISNKGLLAKYDIFINMFTHKEKYLNDFYWNIYGVTKNIQTMSIDNLYINTKTNEKSKITNFDTSNLCLDKINVFGEIDNETNNKVIEQSMFICCFDNPVYINYSLLNVIASGAIPVFYTNYAKNIHINQKQTLYDINCGIYIDDDFISKDDTIIMLNKYIISQNSCKSLIIKNKKIFKQLFNTENIIKNLLDNIL